MYMHLSYITEANRMQNNGCSPIKTEFINGSVNAGVCDRKHCLKLQAEVAGRKGTEYPKEKRKQRVEVLAAIENLLNSHTTGTINCWWLDDLLDEKLLLEDCMERFADRMDRLRIFSPNLKADVVERLVQKGGKYVVTGCGCTCRFNEMCREAIKTMGGLDLVMLDAFGGPENNVVPMLEQMLSLQLFRSNAGVLRPGTSLVGVFCDLNHRFKKNAASAVALRTMKEVQRLFNDSAFYVTIVQSYMYGRSMHVLNCVVSSRDWLDTSLEGFVGRRYYVEVSSNRIDVMDVDSPPVPGDSEEEPVQMDIPTDDMHANDTVSMDIPTDRTVNDTVPMDITRSVTRTPCETLEKDIAPVASPSSTPMMPYKYGLLRCHPSFVQLQDTLNENIRTTSSLHVKWKCCICGLTFLKKINNIPTSTGRCRCCSILLIGNKDIYNGDIPLLPRTIIRTGILQGIQIDALIHILQNEEGGHSVGVDTYHEWIRELKKCTTPELLNNRYWNRKDILWLTKKRRIRFDGDSSTTLENEETPKRKNQKNFNEVEQQLSTWMRRPRWWIHWAHWAPVMRMAKKTRKHNDILQYYDTEIYWRLFLPPGLRLSNLESFFPSLNWPLVRFALFGLLECIEMHYNILNNENIHILHGDYLWVHQTCNDIPRRQQLSLRLLIRRIEENVPQIID